MFWGAGQVGIDSIELRVPRGTLPRRSLEGQGGVVLSVGRLIGYHNLQLHYSNGVFGSVLKIKF